MAKLLVDLVVGSDFGGEKSEEDMIKQNVGTNLALI